MNPMILLIMMMMTSSHPAGRLRPYGIRPAGLYYILHPPPGSPVRRIQARSIYKYINPPARGTTKNLFLMGHAAPLPPSIPRDSRRKRGWRGRWPQRITKEAGAFKTERSKGLVAGRRVEFELSERRAASQVKPRSVPSAERVYPRPPRTPVMRRTTLIG